MADGWLGFRGQLVLQLPCPSASTHAHPRSAHTGYGSSHIGLGSIWKHGDHVGQACCKQRAKPTRLWDEANRVGDPPLFAVPSDPRL
jgi:hypothetical protein